MFEGEIPPALEAIVNNLHVGKGTGAQPPNVLAVSHDDAVAEAREEFPWYLLVVHGLAIGDGGLFDMELLTLPSLPSSRSVVADLRPPKKRGKALADRDADRDAMELLEKLGADFEALASFEPAGKQDRTFCGKRMGTLRNQWIRKHQERPLTAVDLFTHSADGPSLRKGVMCMWHVNRWEVLRATTRSDLDLNNLFVCFSIAKRYMFERGPSSGVQTAWKKIYHARS